MTSIGIPSIPESPLVIQQRKHRELMDKLDKLELLLRSLGAVTPAERKVRE
jgi:hypothetical protein